MVRIGIPRRPGPVLSTTTLYPPPNTSSNVANKQLYGVQLYGPDAPHIRFAATRYATEARRLLQSLLPSSSTPPKPANTQRIDDTTNRALVYAAESRRLLSTAQALEAASGRSFPPWVPPSNKPYFSCALNVITTELSPADAAVADQADSHKQQDRVTPELIHDGLCGSPRQGGQASGFAEVSPRRVPTRRLVAV